MRHISILSLIALLFFACTDDEEMFSNDIEMVSNDEEMVSNNVEGSTEYLVTFTIDWNNTDFPTNYPSNAHFSRLIGWSHDSDQSFFKTGTFASNGIKSMAETGGTSILNAEIMELIEEGKGYSSFIGSNLNSGTGEIELKVEVTEQFSSITLATMIAPSPDWYIAVVNINLIENDSFVNEKIVEAQVYDAGTDSGVTYSSPNEITNPQQSITLFVDSPVGNGVELNASIASVTFTKL